MALFFYEWCGTVLILPIASAVPVGDCSLRVVEGGDVRLTSNELKLTLAEGLMDAGADVIGVGFCGDELVSQSMQQARGRLRDLPC